MNVVRNVVPEGSVRSLHTGACLLTRRRPVTQPTGPSCRRYHKSKLERSDMLFLSLTPPIERPRGFCRNLSYAYLPGANTAPVRPLALEKYFLRFFVRMVFTRHFDLARGHLFILLLGSRARLQLPESSVLPAAALRQQRQSFLLLRGGAFHVCVAAL